jgi:hypothetical protein
MIPLVRLYIVYYLLARIYQLFVILVLPKDGDKRFTPIVVDISDASELRFVCLSIDPQSDADTAGHPDQI